MTLKLRKPGWDWICLSFFNPFANDPPLISLKEDPFSGLPSL